MVATLYVHVYSIQKKKDKGKKALKSCLLKVAAYRFKNSFLQVADAQC